MTTYRLLNNIFEYHEPIIEFKQFRRQFDGVKVWFNQNNESLTDKLKGDWVPIEIQFSSDRKNNKIPDISVWNLSCLVLSDEAKKVLEPELKHIGEFFLSFPRWSVGTVMFHGTSTALVTVPHSLNT